MQYEKYVFILKMIYHNTSFLTIKMYVTISYDVKKWSNKPTKQRKYAVGMLVAEK